MSGVRHREEGVAQEGRSSLRVCLGERDPRESAQKGGESSLSDRTNQSVRGGGGGGKPSLRSSGAVEAEKDRAAGLDTRP